MQTLSTSSQEQSVKKLARLGQINFINSLPVVVPLLSRVQDIEAEITLGTPSELNKKYANNELDLGAMSSFFYLKSRAMDLISGLSISSVGRVGSVLFFSKHELGQLGGRSIAVPRSSATSINLLDVLLKEQFGVSAHLIPAEKPDLSKDEFDGALVIGDRALLVDQDWSKQYVRADMGEWWFENFHLPMTFGVWAAQQSWAANEPEAFVSLSQILCEAARTGLTTSLNDVIVESMRRLSLSRERLERYFLQELNFEFTDDHQQGLELYRQLCIKHKLLHIPS